MTSFEPPARSAPPARPRRSALRFAPPPGAGRRCARPFVVAALATLLLLLAPTASAATYQVSARTLDREAATSVLVPAGGKVTLLLPVRAEHPVSVEVQLAFQAPTYRAPGWTLDAALHPPEQGLPTIRESGAGPTLLLSVAQLNEAPEPREMKSDTADEATKAWTEALGTRGAGTWKLQLSIPAGAPGSGLRVHVHQTVEELSPQVLALVGLSGGPGVAAHPLWQWSLLALVPAAAGLGWYTLRVRRHR